MKRTAFLTLIALTLIIAGCSQNPKSWQQLSHPTANEVAANFQSPPPEYAITMTWGWDGPITEEVIIRDLDIVNQRGFRAVTIEAGYDMDNAPYLTEGWFEMVRFAVEQAKTRDMRVWIIDEGKYPSGFAGGLFSKERPDLRMMGLGVAQRFDVAPGETIERDLPKETVGVLAINLDDNEAVSLDVVDSKLTWTAPESGNWRVHVVDANYRTPVTRAVNDPKRAKTTANSVGDLINPAAVQQFIDWTHEQYKTYLGDLIGTTVLGFRGDEPEFAATPWTDGIVELFQEEKGYDVTPYLPYLARFGRRDARLVLTDEQRRAKADYWDVWSKLYGQHFFGMQAQWCVDNGVEHMTHLNNEHNLANLTFTSGDYFRDLREVQIPGVDSIWNQVWPGKNADFVRLPASVAHVYGKPRVISESFAAYSESPVTVETAAWCTNYQIVRGINLFEYMFYPASAHPWEKIREQYHYMADPEFPAMVGAANRACYVMSQGRSDTRIAIYFPSMDLWYGDNQADRTQWALAQELLEHQRDFDFVDDDAFAEVLTLKDGQFVNLSGQAYQTVILPNVTAITQAALDRLQAFAQAGGQVVIIGELPTMVVKDSFMKAQAPQDLSWAQQVGEPTFAAVAEFLPAPNVQLNEPCPDLKVMHKRWQDADVYFMFNEAKESMIRQVTLTGRGEVQEWDTQTGDINPLQVSSANAKVQINLEFSPYEAIIIVISP